LSLFGAAPLASSTQAALEATVMTKTILISGALLALTVSVAAAGGINLAWNDCLGMGGVSNKAFACNSNAGNNDLYVSFDPGLSIPDVNGSNPVVDLQAFMPTLPAWWQFKNIGACRQTSLTASVGPGSCVDTWQGQGTAGIAAYFTQANAPQIVPTPCRARILGAIAVPSSLAGPVEPGTEYFCFLIRINNAKTAGASACADCQTPVFLVLNEILLTSNNSGDNRISAPLQQNYASWQGAWFPDGGCPGATPAVNQTWGQVKSIYR
jgi:hypothetical protein